MYRNSSNTKVGTTILPSINPVFIMSDILPSIITLVSNILGIAPMFFLFVFSFVVIFLICIYLLISSFLILPTFIPI